MNPAIVIRNETDTDVSTITAVTVAAFKTLEISNHTEQFIIEALRAAKALTLSLVAEADGRVVGHIAFSPVTISDGTMHWYGLGPVSVLPAYQRKGIGEMKTRVGRETTIISVMNGIESEVTIGTAQGMEKVLYAVSVGIDGLRDGNRINFKNQGKIFFGEARNPFISDRVRRVQNLFDKAGIIYETPPDMIRILWWKFMINVGINQAPAVLRAPFGVFQASPEAGELMGSAIGKTSMLQDIEAGRKTEVEIFAGKVIELGVHHNVPTPVNQMPFDMIKEIEGQ